MTEPIMRLAGQSQRNLSKRIGFTIAVLERTACPPGKGRIWAYDARTPGLAFMVTENGAKSFYLYRKVNGRPQRIRLGGFPDISVEQARQLAMKTTGEIAQGKDPQAEKRMARAKGMSVSDLFNWFLDNHAKPRKRSWKDDEERYEKHIKSRIGSRYLMQVTRADVAAIHRHVAEKHSQATANRVLALVSVLFNKARMIGYEGQNPAEGVERFREQSRDRFIHPGEMPTFWKALEAEPNVDMQAFFKLCLLVGARSGNVKSMRWDELDLAAGTWRIPDTKAKAGETILVHLPALAVDVLQKREGNKSEWVFPSHSKSGHLQEPKKAWAARLVRAGLSGLRIHDLRRTMGSWQAATGASLPVIGKSLGHKNVSTTAIYARLNLDPVKESVNKATAAMMVAAKAKPKKPGKAKRNKEQ